MFRGRSGIGLAEWIEEAKACMRARNLFMSDQAFFLFDHLEGEAREEIKYRPGVDCGDPPRIIAILQELYGCSESYVALLEAFFSRRQQEGETLLEFFLALLSLMASVKQRAPSDMSNAQVLLQDQFVEHVHDCALRHELKQFLCRQPTATLLEVRGEAIRWEREGVPVSSSSGLGKLAPTGLQSHSSGGASTGSGVVSSDLGDAFKSISSCPHLDVDMGGVKVPCLVDTGSMVSTITESFLSSILSHGVRSDSDLVTGCSLEQPMAWPFPIWVPRTGC